MISALLAAMVGVLVVVACLLVAVLVLLCRLLADAEIDGRVHYIVKCGTCHCTSGVMQMSRPAAAEAWNRRAERTCRMDKSEFADFAPEYEGLHSCHKCGEQTAVLACVNEDGDMEWIKPRFCGYCGAMVVTDDE